MIPIQTCYFLSIVVLTREISTALPVIRNLLDIDVSQPLQSFVSLGQKEEFKDLYRLEVGGKSMIVGGSVNLSSFVRSNLFDFWYSSMIPVSK